MPIDSETTPWIQQQMLDFMRTTADSAIERNVWDEERPRLWLIAKRSKPLGFPEVAVAELPVPEALWESAPPGVVLPILAQGCRANPYLLDREVREELHGIVMLAETWDLVIPEDATAQEKEQAHEFSQRRGIADHPWGVEAKTMFARDIDGWDLFISRRRGATSGPEWASAPGEDQVEGRIRDGLQELLDALR